MSTDDKVPTDAELAGTADKEPDPPVYDERGNVRPRGTEGARPMTYKERVEIAKRIAAEADADADTAPEDAPDGPTAHADRPVAPKPPVPVKRGATGDSDDSGAKR